MFDIVTCGELLAEFVAERLDLPGHQLSWQSAVIRQANCADLQER